MSVRGRFAILDPLRGLAAISVVIYHALTDLLPIRQQVAQNPGHASLIDWGVYVLSCGSLGVPVFFLISGYCISAAADNHIRNGYSLSRFLHRRMVRIYPPYWGCLLVCFGLSFVPGAGISFSGMTFTQWLGNIFLFEKYRHWFLPPESSHQVLGASWTLCYEEQFYLLSAFLLLIAPRYLFRVFAVISVFVVVNNYNLNIGPLRRFGDLNQMQMNVDDLLIDPFWLFFSAGIGLFCFRTTTTWKRYLFPAVLLIFAVWEIRQMDWYTYRYSSRVFTICVALGLCLAGQYDDRVSGWTWLKPLRWLGTRSYSIYLLHMPLTFILLHCARQFRLDKPLLTLFIVVPSVLLVSILAGAVFYHRVERHFIPGQSKA